MHARPRLAAAALCCGLALSAGPVLAADNDDFDFDTTEDLFGVCGTAPEQPEHTVARFACRAFIEATMQYHDAVADRKNVQRLVCYPATATIGDGSEAFVTWAEANKDNTALMAEQPVMGVVRALAARYPCK